MPVRTLIKKISRLLVILPLAALATENNDEIKSLPLSESVTAAIAAGDCEQLIVALNQRYRDDSVDGDPEAIAALEDAILALPGCGRVVAVLLRVEPLQGVNFFDPERPVGAVSVQP
jgi:hypothetical protein